MDGCGATRLGKWSRPYWWATAKDQWRMKDHEAQSEKLSDIAESLGKLSAMASGQGHAFLAYLIDMASAEAANQKASIDYAAVLDQARRSECRCP